MARCCWHAYDACTMAWSLPLRSVLVPYNFTRASDEALRVARTMVAEDAHVQALYVTGLPAAGDPASIWGQLDTAGVVDRATASLKEAMERNGIAAGYKAILGTGGPGDEIAEWATRQNVDLIVMPSHGRSGLSRVLLGSVTERVMRLAKAPVLVIRVNAD